MLSHEMKTGGRGLMSSPRVSGPVREVPPPLPSKRDTGVFWPEGKAPDEARPHTGPVEQQEPNEPESNLTERELIGRMSPEQREKRISLLKERLSKLYALHGAQEKIADFAEGQLESLKVLKAARIDLGQATIEEAWKLLPVDTRERVMTALGELDIMKPSAVRIQEALAKLPEPTKSELKDALLPSRLVEIVEKNRDLQMRLKHAFGDKIAQTNSVITYAEQLTGRLPDEEELLEPVRRKPTKLELERRLVNLQEIIARGRDNARESGGKLQRLTGMPLEMISRIPLAFPGVWHALKFKMSREELKAIIEDREKMLQELGESTPSMKKPGERKSNNDLLQMMKERLLAPGADLEKISRLVADLDSYRQVSLDAAEIEQELKDFPAAKNAA